MAKKQKERELPKKWEKGKFKYILTTNIYFWPRKLADELSYSPSIKYFVSIKDLQNDTHEYGDTFVIPHKKK